MARMGTHGTVLQVDPRLGAETEGQSAFFATPVSITTKWRLRTLAYCTAAWHLQTKMPEAVAGARDDDPAAGAGVAVLNHAASPADLRRKNGKAYREDPCGGIAVEARGNGCDVRGSTTDRWKLTGALDLNEALARGELGWDLTGACQYCVTLVAGEDGGWRGPDT
ncbi:hypothetical protein B0H17DRAFT_1135356 [Mycena rosella]|uniref:Uncharacterized protein n=1 Tax=Mycena rosella TaxID=1033263 RepID=A0AAD7DG79_MYCRO|nr:hypothetical protein B0H17DRAFT_1135356 [Mycena rosella]